MSISYASPSSVNLVSMSNSSSSNSVLSMLNRQVKVIPLQHPCSNQQSSSSSSSSNNDSVFKKWKAKTERMTWLDWMKFFFPCVRWITTYNVSEYLQPDLMAGITVGIMLVPQAMSYAKLAGLHPIYGLYSGSIPIFVYAIFGSSRQLAIGPVALVSLLVSNVLGKIADPTDALYTQLAILLALMVGILECVMGILRLGWIIRFISHSVISGFTTSSAIIIALSQAKYFLGYSIVRSSEIIPLIESVIAGAHQFSWRPFVMGSSILAILLIMKHLGKTKKSLRFLRAGGPLTAVVLGTAFVKIFHPASISVVGDIPQGLPKFSVPKSFDHVRSLIPTALLITGVAILESVGIAKALAAKNGYELDSNQELFGLGVANICGSFFSAYPTTGSFSRSAVNHESGAKTGLAGLTMGVIMCCALLFMTPLFRDIPQCALAAIVISAVMGLVDYDEAIFLWRVDKKDFFLWTVTSVTTLFLGIEYGVLIGVGFSLAFVIHESANPHIAVLGRLPGTTVYRNSKQYPEAYTYHGIVIVRIDAPIYFANTSFIKERLQFRTQTGKYYWLLRILAYLIRLGKSGFFVRVHDAVQVCLQHVQSLNESPKSIDLLDEKKSNFFQRLSKHQENDGSNTESESGNKETRIFIHPDETGDRRPDRPISLFGRQWREESEKNPHTEPLLPRKD
ncbi:hypothetical protein MKX01_017158 [Papaver californicum]|nr:hypothetical protein MKX01_017158 [Papaver californicum]